ncbi:hypothetical protein M2139_001467 [Enterococcus sp. PF1-24]|uniref:hypothetical protein n=1 Tax=unclassified Enterococcus TaxID=2608891 RepID=UPI0024740959|nr:MULTISPECIES: hypothetical protein [unclassified Enterococcus]MDH6364542.1 hypothetical protein [Enterococcus sp. PFB1-1]MDH6401581.1 hypothetical protein [Enterococcus sp. PF1-24]
MINNVVGDYNDEYFSYFSNQVKEGKIKNIEQLVTYVKNKFEIEQFSINKLTQSFLQAQKFNALHRYSDVLNIESLDFHAIRIIKTPDSNYYFSSQDSGYSPLELPSQSPEEDLLLFLYEDQTNYFWVNNSHLHCELITERGISQESIEKQDSLFLEYESCKQRFMEYRKRIKE